MSAFVTFHVFVAPLIRSLLGRVDVYPGWVVATVAADIPHRPGRTEMVRVRLHRGGARAPDPAATPWLATPHPRQGSSALHSVADIDGLLVVPAAMGAMEQGVARACSTHPSPIHPRCRAIFLGNSLHTKETVAQASYAGAREVSRTAETSGALERLPTNERMRLPPSIQRAIDATQRRIRLQRALDAGGVFLTAGLGVVAITLTLGKLDLLTRSQVAWGVAMAMALPLIGLALGALRGVPRLLPAQLLDRAHDLRSRVANAVELSEESSPTPFMQAAISDAARHGEVLDARRALPLRAPHDLWVPAALLVGVVVLANLAVPLPPPAPVAQPSLAPLLLDDDSIDAFDASLDPGAERPRDFRGCA